MLIRFLPLAHLGTIRVMCCIGEPKSEEIMGASSFAVKPQARRAGQFVCRILLLDSDRNHSDNTVISLEQMGHQVRRAYHGVTAFNIAQAFVPDIMLIDMTSVANGLAV